MLLPGDDDEDDHHPLLPGLPDHVAHLCLSRVPPSTLFNVCRSWRQLIYSSSFPSFLSIYALLLPINFPDRTQYLDSGCFFTFDPVSGNWRQIPIPPDELCLLHRHPSFLSRDLSVQSISSAGNLVILAGTTEHFLPALPRPLVFNPISREWSFGPKIDSPRRWCAAGELGGVIYMASGMGSHYNSRIARSVEKWDCNDDKWEKLGEMRNGNFCREGTELINWKGRLWMVNVKGSGAKEGVCYDVVNDDWVAMPADVICGWKGPAATTVDGEILYVVDEEEGVLRKYDDGIWVDVWGEERLKGANRVAVRGGKVCVVCSGGEILMLDVVAPVRTWVVETPPGFRAVTVHVLPRMTEPEMEFC